MATFLAIMLPLAVVLVGAGTLMAGQAGRVLIVLGIVLAGIYLGLTLTQA